MPLRCIVCLLLLVIMAGGPTRCIAETPVRDIIAAREWCDEAMLHRIEGIWEFPDDETTVLIKRDTNRPHYYNIVVIASPDVRLTPGENAGYVKETAEKNKFEMALIREPALGLLNEQAKCLATLTDNDNVIVAKGRKVRFALKTRWLFPSFWKMINMTVKDPLENLPHGLIRVYPAPRRNPDYL